MIVYVALCIVYIVPILLSDNIIYALLPISIIVVTKTGMILPIIMYSEYGRKLDKNVLGVLSILLV